MLKCNKASGATTHMQLTLETLCMSTHHKESFFKSLIVQHRMSW